ncbi:MAG: type II toxin-antitoxin system ParD family antitoxin [Aquisalinus sp.]|nr:type II toxin-antitoxin system ParD family antitoxin [Aquisalinus sp.]
MSTMNISLPSTLKEWVEEQARDGNYSNTSDYMRDLIRQEQTRREKIAHMQQLVTEALESGAGSSTPDELLARARAAVSGS